MLTGASTKATLKSAADETEPALLSPPSAPSCDFISTRRTGRRTSATPSRLEASKASRRRWTERIEQTMRRDETCSVSLAPFSLSMWEEKRSDNKRWGGGFVSGGVLGPVLPMPYPSKTVTHLSESGP